MIKDGREMKTEEKKTGLILTRSQSVNLLAIHISLFSTSFIFLSFPPYLNISRNKLCVRYFILGN